MTGIDKLCYYVGNHLVRSKDMSKYRQHLKNKYKALSLSSPKELLECSSSKYVSLHLEKFDKESKKYKKHLVFGYFDSIFRKQSHLPHQTEKCNKPLTFTDVLNVKEEENKVILIEGGPGMGKSTLAIKICKCWADDKLLKEYDAVILLPLRYHEIQDARNISDLLLVENKKDLQVLVDEITTSQGDKICFIFEGYDELPDQLRDIPVFARLREKLPLCTLIYTSRPQACSQLRRVAFQRIEIQGFEDEQVDEYIINAFDTVEDGKEKAQKLISQVKSNPSIKSLLYIPIYVAIICHLFLFSSTLPNTLTELYTLLCLNIIIRHINRNSHDKVAFLDSLNDLPTTTNKQFSNLCLIAFRGSREDKIVFSSREIKGYGIDPSTLSCLGLLLIAPNTSVFGWENSYNFLHLTVQEFCGAFYIANIPDEEQFHCFMKYQFHERFQGIWRIHSGITKLKNKGIFHHMLPSKWVESDYRKKRTIELLHCVYEAHKDDKCYVVGNHLDGNIDLSFHKLYQIDCSAVGYLLEQYREEMKLIDLSSCNIDDEGCEILLNSLLMHPRNSYPSKFQLILNTNNIGAKSFSLMDLLLSSNYPVDKLDVSLNDLSSSADILFKSLQSNTALTELILGFTALRSSDMQSLVQMLTSNNTLSVIDISNNDIGLGGCQYLADCRNISLDKLIMRWCELGVNGADKIGEMLYHDTSITSVDLAYNNIGDHGVEKLVKHLKSNHTIKHLNLLSNEITSVGANHLSKLFSLDHTAINSLQLGKNPLKDKGVDLMLHSITITMEYVGLCNTESSCSSVSTALHKIKSISLTPPDNCSGISDSIAGTTTLEELELRDGSDTAYHTMISGINRNSSIRKLRFTHGNFHHKTVLDVAQIIKFNRTITELIISYVIVSSTDDYLLLANVLPLNIAIQEMRLCPSFENSLNQSLVLQFLKQLKDNYTLKVLILGVTVEAKDDEQFIRDVEALVGEMNDIRQSHDVITLFRVKLEV